MNLFQHFNVILIIRIIIKVNTFIINKFFNVDRFKKLT